MLTSLARLLEVSNFQKMETASRVQRAQSSARSQLARDRGNLHLIKEEIVEINRECVAQCVNDQLAEFTGRKKTGNSLGACPSCSDRHQTGAQTSCKRSRSGRPKSGANRTTRRRGYSGGRSPRDSKRKNFGRARSPKKVKEAEVKRGPKNEEKRK